MRVLAVSSLLLVAACSTPRPVEVPFVEVPFVEAPPMQERPDFRGQTLDAVLADLGPPVSDTEFVVTDSTRLVEDRSALYRFIPESGTLQVRELGWERPRGRRLLVWFQPDGQGWSGLEGLEWDADTVQF